MYCQTSSSVQFESGNAPDVFAGQQPAVVQVPQLGPLALGVPLPERVAEGENALFRASLLLVAARTAEQRVEAVFGDRVEQRDRLQSVARRARAGLFDDPAGVDAVLDRGDDQLDAKLGGPPVAELKRLGEVVAGVDVHDREGDAGRPEGLLGQTQHHDRVLAAREEQHGTLALGGDLADDVDSLGLEPGDRLGARLGFVERRRRRGGHLASQQTCLRDGV